MSAELTLGLAPSGKTGVTNKYVSVGWQRWVATQNVSDRSGEQGFRQINLTHHLIELH